MISARQNCSELVCTPIGDRAPGPAEGWATCAIRIEAADAVEGWPHLLGEKVGSDVTALLPPLAAELLPPVGRWRVHAELVRPGLVRLSSDPAHIEVMSR